jgi:hypothetical protein
VDTTPSPRYGTGIRWILYLVSALVSVPTAGLIIWLVLSRQPDLESKALGRRCGIIALVVFVIVLAVIVVIAALVLIGRNTTAAFNSIAASPGG